MEMRYITTDETGWLMVKIERGDRIVALPEYLRSTSQGGREPGIILRSLRAFLWGLESLFPVKTRLAPG